MQSIHSRDIIHMSCSCTRYVLSCVVFIELCVAIFPCRVVASEMCVAICRLANVFRRPAGLPEADEGVNGHEGCSDCHAEEEGGDGVGDWNYMNSFLSASSMILAKLGEDADL